MRFAAMIEEAKAIMSKAGGQLLVAAGLKDAIADTLSKREVSTATVSFPLGASPMKRTRYFSPPTAKDSTRDCLDPWFFVTSMIRGAVGVADKGRGTCRSLSRCVALAGGDQRPPYSFAIPIRRARFGGDAMLCRRPSNRNGRRVAREGRPAMRPRYPSATPPSARLADHGERRPAKGREARQRPAVWAGLVGRWPSSVVVAGRTAGPTEIRHPNDRAS
jgi:hypothetical protein